MRYQVVSHSGSMAWSGQWGWLLRNQSPELHEQYDTQEAAQVVADNLSPRVRTVEGGPPPYSTPADD